MMRRHSLAIGAVSACLAIALLDACASQHRDTTAFVAPALRFHAPGPRELGASVQVAQLITARYGAETYVFEAQLSVSPDRLTLLCFDPFGRRALTIVSTGIEVKTDAAPWLPAELRAENILADIAMVYWPADAVQRGFRGTSALVVSDARRRTITIEGREIIRVDYDSQADRPWPSSARYRNHAFGYELTLRSAAPQ